jgi:GT2 family glycosyltransferase
MKNDFEKLPQARIFFVILHYKNLDITIQSVEALLQLDYIDKCGIVIVDNASRDGTGVKLKNMFDSYANIWVLLNEQDKGFSAGNNIGYAYAKSKGADYIVCMNNDIVISQKEFVKLLLDCKTDASVIGPDIVTPDGKHQNPMRKERLSPRRIRYIIGYNLVISWIYANKITGRMYLRMLERRKRHRNLPPQTKAVCGTCVLHGACVIFLPKWIQAETFAFVPGIYMYGEEDLLAEYAHGKGHQMCCQPKLWVKHMESASTRMTYSTEIERRRFKSKNMLRSFIFIDRFRRGKITIT